MEDHSKILEFINSTTDKEKLKTLAQRAREQGAKQVEEAAFKKFISIVPEADPGTLEHDFWTSIHAFEHVLSEEKGKTIRLSRTRQKVDRDGIVATLEGWANGKQTEGFDMLIDRGMPELTGEAVVLRHPGRFSEDIVEAARQRLIGSGCETEGL